MVDVDDQPSDQATNRKDQLGGEGGEHEDELHQRIEEVEAGGGKDPRQTKDRPHQTLPEFPQQEKEWEQVRLLEILKNDR